MIAMIAGAKGKPGQLRSKAKAAGQRSKTTLKTLNAVKACEVCEVCEVYLASKRKMGSTLQWSTMAPSPPWHS